MTIDNATTILLSGASLVAGAFLGAVRSKLFAEKSKNNLHLVFYFFGGVLLLAVLILSFKFCKEFFIQKNIYGIIVLILAFLAGLALILFTRKFLVVKTIYTVEELTPIINKFTVTADTDEIKLFGGDLDFLGKTPEDVDRNSQYIELKTRGFKKIYILCQGPINRAQKIRYGKIYHDMNNVEMKYYDPEKADLKVRGRISKLQGRIRLLVYTKHEHGYEAIATDTSNAKGLLYDNIWHLTWFLAKAPKPEEIEEYKKLYNEK